MNTLVMTIEVWTDGSCINNGKPGASCGIGVYYPQYLQRNVSAQLPGGKATNNRAELCAVLYTLCTNYGSDHIVIHTDSQYSINCITQYREKWEKNGWKTSNGRPVEWSRIIRYICLLIDSRMEKGGSTTFVYVKGHSGDVNNDSADTLAREAVIHKRRSNRSEERRVGKECRN